MALIVEISPKANWMSVKGNKTQKPMTRKEAREIEASE